MAVIFKRLQARRIGVLALCVAMVLPPSTVLALEPALTADDFAKFPDYLKQPNFHAPSAGHCKRPIRTREVSTQQQAGSNDHLKSKADGDVLRRHSPAMSMAAPALAAAPAAASVAGRAADSIAYEAAPKPTDKLGAKPSLQTSITAVAPVQQSQIVTAGVVDDNADFGKYSAFRSRTQVVHRARDVSERYLLQVRDVQDKPVHDAQVRITSPQGHGMWARTDTAGHVWVHPKAFIPEQEPARVLDVLVEKQNFKAQTQLVRGQKSAVQVKLDSQSATAKAQLDLVFLIDATGSMGDEIDKLKASLRTIVSDIAQLPSQPDLCLGMVAYRDKGDAFLLRSHDFTNDVNAFQGVLNALQAAGGGDTPEAMNEALHDAVHNLSWRGQGATRLMVLLADAPPHLDYGTPHYDNTAMAALGKGIKIFSVGASGLDKQGEYIQRQIAQYTGGRFVFLTYNQANQPASGHGSQTVHDVQNYSVDTLDRLVVRLVKDELSRL
jgi:Mg-chelatase subunit ChlD